MIEAADRLGVSPRRVQALVAGGRLPGEKVAGVWLVDPVDVARLGLRSGRRGRPLSPTGAWALLARLEGGAGLAVYRGPAVCRDRGWLVNQVSRRGERRRLRCLPGLLEDCAGELVVGGESAGVYLGFGVSGSARRVEGYVRQSSAGGLVGRYRLKPAVGDDVNVLLRVVDDAVWPFAEGQRHVGPLVAAVDIAGDPVDDRAVEIAGPVIDAVLAP